MRKLEVRPDVLSDSVNPLLHQQLILRQCVKEDKQLLLTSIRRALRYTTMISAWHEDRLGASEQIVRFDVAHSPYANANIPKWLALPTNYVTLLGI